MALLSEFFTEEEKREILLAIKDAEKNSSGEIRVRIEKKAGKDIQESARKAFVKLGMKKTEDHNGVLIFLALQDKKFAIIGDEGIDLNVPPSFWADIKDLMQTYFQNGFFVKGLSEGIRLSGYMLSKYFPFQKDDTNELPDAISFEEDSL